MGSDRTFRKRLVRLVGATDRRCQALRRLTPGNAESGKVARMTYHGKVRVGGRPDTRELPDLIITKVAVGPMDNNA